MHQDPGQSHPSNGATADRLSVFADGVEDQVLTIAGDVTGGLIASLTVGV
jgi:hypothetical protein